MHLGYTFSAGMLGNDTVSLTVNNVFNTSPPFFNGSTGYDNYVSAIRSAA